jgi:hypothetical protein
MKKWILALSVGLMALSVSAQQELTIVNTGSKGGGFFIETNAYTQDLTATGEFKIDYINPGNLCAALAIVNKVDKNTPVLFPWDSTFEAGTRMQKTCPLTFTADELIVVKYDVYRICSAKPELNLTRLLEPGASFKIGHTVPNNLFDQTINEGLNKSFKTNHKSILFSTGNSSTITAMANGEIDYGIIESKLASKFVKSGAGQCFARLSTDQVDGFVPLAAKDPTNKKLQVGYYVIYLLKNATHAQREKIKLALQKVHSTPESNTYKIWDGIGMKFIWDTKFSAFVPEWEDSVNIFIEK